MGPGVGAAAGATGVTLAAIVAIRVGAGPGVTAGARPRAAKIETRLKQLQDAGLPTIDSFLPINKMSAALSFPSSVLEHILSFNPTHRELWAEVMNDLVLATHCHSCGASAAVCLRGYVGQHCSKQCWKWNELSAGDDFDCPYGPDCKTCAGVFVSLANSRWHRVYHDAGSPTGACWPMGDTRRPCANECIKTRPPIKVGYGTEDDE